jgi:hypothetical protein
MMYGRSILEDIRLAKEAGIMVFGRQVLLPLQQRRQSFANEDVCGSSPQAVTQATAGKRHQRQWVVEDEQEDAAAVEEEAVVLEEDLSDEEADSAGPVKLVVPAWEVLAADRGGWSEGSQG